jgi:hypothetical protein
MFKPLNKAEVLFDLIDEIGADGRNSQAFSNYPGPCAGRVSLIPS